jgi:hypothetical protein
MTTPQAIAIAEGYVSARDEQQYLDAWQMLVDTGLAWRLQGWFGRMAIQMIEDELIIASESHDC